MSSSWAVSQLHLGVHVGVGTEVRVSPNLFLMIVLSPVLTDIMQSTQLYCTRPLYSMNDFPVYVAKSPSNDWAVLMTVSTLPAIWRLQHLKDIVMSERIQKRGLKLWLHHLTTWTCFLLCCISKQVDTMLLYAICYNTNRVYMNVPYHNRSSEYQSEPASSPSEEVQDYHFSMKVYAKTMHRIMQ